MRPSLYLLAAALVAVQGMIGWSAVQRPERRGVFEPTETGYRVDVNRADEATLRLLPGVGPSLAERIVAHRRAQGPFTDLGRLDEVKGLGPVTLSRVRLFAVCGDAEVR